MLIYKYLELHINDHQYWWPQQLGLQTFIAGRQVHYTIVVNQ